MAKYFAFLAALFFAAPAVAAEPAPLIVISIDGFRADYFGRGLTPTLAMLAKDGVRATAMHPSFPSLTYPNHYTLVTGFRPDHHGVIANTIWDPSVSPEKFTTKARTRNCRAGGKGPSRSGYRRRSRAASWRRAAGLAAKR